MIRVPWLALAALAVALGARLAAWLAPLSPPFPGCAFKQITGVACATCGLTRCVTALGAGDWSGAFHWHPPAAVVMVLLPLGALWDLRRAWRGDPYPDLPSFPGARWAAWGLLLGVWALQALRGI